MGCTGCGAKYRSVRSLNKQSLSVPVKYPEQTKPSKKVVKTPTQPKKVDAQLAVVLLSSISSSMIK